MPLTFNVDDDVKGRIFSTKTIALTASAARKKTHCKKSFN